MEKIYSVFQHINDEDHRLNRNDYLLTLLLYNILANMFVAILVNGFNLITRQGIDTWGGVDIRLRILLVSTTLHQPLSSLNGHRFN